MELILDIFNSLLLMSLSLFQTWEAGVVMDADNIIQLAQCLNNRARPVYTFAICYLSQDRGQRSWSAKTCLISCILMQDMLLSSKLDQIQGYFNVHLCR